MGLLNNKGMINGIVMAFVTIMMIGVFLAPITEFTEMGVNGTSSALVQTIVNLFPIMFVVGAIALIFNLITQPRIGQGF